MNEAARTPEAELSETTSHQNPPRLARQRKADHVQRQTQKALLRVQRAERAAQKAQQKYLELKLDELLQRDKTYLDLQRQMEAASKKLTRQRVGRARKRDSIKASERRIRERHRQIEEHNRQEVLCQADCQAIEQALQARREAKRRELIHPKPPI